MIKPKHTKNNWWKILLICSSTTLVMGGVGVAVGWTIWHNKGGGGVPSKQKATKIIIDNSQDNKIDINSTLNNSGTYSFHAHNDIGEVVDSNISWSLEETIEPGTSIAIGSSTGVLTWSNNLSLTTHTFIIKCTDTDATRNLSEASCTTNIVVTQTPGNDICPYSYFSVSNQGVLTLSSIGSQNKTKIKKVIIPANINGKNVSSIGNSAFRDCTALVSVDLGSVGSVGIEAFYNCLALTSVDLGSVNYIGAGAFTRCPSLASITYKTVPYATGSSELKDNDYVLVDETGVATITPSTPKTITNGFLTQYKFVKPSSPTTNKLVAIGCLAIGDIKIPAGIVSFGDSAFASCSNITSITLPNSLTSISEHAFQYCSALVSVDLSDVNSISDFAFDGCMALASVDLGSVGSIGDNAFEGCMALVSVDLGSVGWIGVNAFRNCSALSSVDLGSVGSIGDSAFENCSALASIKYTTPSGALGSDNYVLVDETGVATIAPNTSKTITNGFLTLYKFVKPSSPTTNNLAAIGCLAIGDIKIPAGITSVDVGAFQNCSALASVDLSDVNSISNSAFAYCSALESVDLSDVNSISDYAFSNCSYLVSIDLGSVGSIGDGAFIECSALNSITATLSDRPSNGSWHGGAFNDISSAAGTVKNTPPSGTYNSLQFLAYLKTLNSIFNNWTTAI